MYHVNSTVVALFVSSALLGSLVPEHSSILVNTHVGFCLAGIYVSLFTDNKRHSSILFASYTCPNIYNVSEDFWFNLFETDSINQSIGSMVLWLPMDSVVKARKTMPVCVCPLCMYTEINIV